MSVYILARYTAINFAVYNYVDLELEDQIFQVK